MLCLSLKSDQFLPNDTTFCLIQNFRKNTYVLVKYAFSFFLAPFLLIENIWIRAQQCHQLFYKTTIFTTGVVFLITDAHSQEPLNFVWPTECLPANERQGNVLLPSDMKRLWSAVCEQTRCLSNEYVSLIL